MPHQLRTPFRTTSIDRIAAAIRPAARSRTQSNSAAAPNPLSARSPGRLAWSAGTSARRRCDADAAEPMFRLILLTVREIERTGDWALPLSYFAFWSVRLGGWLP